MATLEDVKNKNMYVRVPETKILGHKSTFVGDIQQ